jgi:DNA-binding NtrC family response regulator
VKILIVDDEPFELFISLKMLRMEYQAEGFNTLADALEWAKSNSFEILISDYYLKDHMSAHDVLMAFRELKGNTFKSLVITNFVDTEKVSELKSAGFNGVIEKPISLEKFKGVLQLI